MVSIANRGSSQPASCDALLHAIGVAVGAGLGVGLVVAVGVGVAAVGRREGRLDGGLKGAGDDLRLRMGVEEGALARTAVAQPVTIRTISTTIVALGFGDTPTQRVAKEVR